MKIYKHEPQIIIRVMIAKHGEETQYLSLCETTRTEVEQLFQKIVKQQNLDPFTKGRVTSINIREAIGAKNGKSKSLSFRGLNPKEVIDLFLKEIEQ